MATWQDASSCSATTLSSTVCWRRSTAGWWTPPATEPSASPTACRQAARALVRLQQLLLEDNREVDAQHQLAVRSGLHWSPVLVDEQFVTGEAVHYAARISSTAGAGEIRISEEAFRELPPAMRPLCRRLEPQSLKGISEPVEMLELDWRDPVRFPTRVEIVEAHEVRAIPYQARVALGRLAEHDGKAANDIVLSHPDSKLSKRISRWHAELEMTAEGYLLRALSRAATEVDGRTLAADEATLIQPGSTARLSSVLTLRFLAPGEANETALGTLLES